MEKFEAPVWLLRSSWGPGPCRNRSQKHDNPGRADYMAHEPLIAMHNDLLSSRALWCIAFMSVCTT